MQFAISATKCMGTMTFNSFNGNENKSGDPSPSCLGLTLLLSSGHNSARSGKEILSHKTWRLGYAG